jgi:CRP-like cAMP-binding protein
VPPEVARLGPGEHFGELSLITGRERSATVTAETPMRCLEVRFFDFRDATSRTRTPT